MIFVELCKRIVIWNTFFWISIKNWFRNIKSVPQWWGLWVWVGGGGGLMWLQKEHPCTHPPTPSSLKTTVLFQADSENVQCDIAHPTRNDEWSDVDHYCQLWTVFHFCRESYQLDWEDQWNIILLLQERLFPLNFDFQRLEFDCCLCQQHKH